jgi:hypothetical protein
MTFRCHEPAHGSLAPDQRPFTLASRSHTSVCAPIHRIRSEITGQVADSKDDAGYAATAARLRVAASVFGR